MAISAFASVEQDFKKFQDIKGKWAVFEDGKKLKVEMTYDLGSRDSIVTEQFGKELAVIYRDGDRLLMTHFCNAGNQPRLFLKSSVGGVMTFEFLDITGAKASDPEAAYVEKVVYRFSTDHIDGEWHWKTPKGPRVERYILKK